MDEPWKLRPYREPRGWMIVWSRWVKDEGRSFDGWMEEFEPSDDETVYPTEEAAQAAIETRLRAARGA